MLNFHIEMIKIKGLLMKRFLLLILLVSLSSFLAVEAENIWQEFEKGEEILIEAILVREDREKTFGNVLTKFYQRIRLEIVNRELQLFSSMLLKVEQDLIRPDKSAIFIDSLKPLSQSDVEQIIVTNNQIDIVFKPEGNSKELYTKLTITKLEERLPAPMIYPIHTCSVALSKFWKKSENGLREVHYHSTDHVVLPPFPLSHRPIGFLYIE
jgi:hypothetical protein